LVIRQDLSDYCLVYKLSGHRAVLAIPYYLSKGDLKFALLNTFDGGFTLKKLAESLGLDLEVAVVSGILDILLSSSGPTEVCRAIAHSDFVHDKTRGVELFYLDASSNLKTVAKYGMEVNGNHELSAWDDSPLSEAIREKKMVVKDTSSATGTTRTIAVPFISNGVPTGLLALRAENAGEIPAFPASVVTALGKLGAFYLETLDFGRISNGTGPIAVNPDDLTSRQLTILGHIEDGLVNLEIAKILMLSESTIRQETVKIYKALGVGNRQEAVKKARALGLLPKRSLTPPPPAIRAS
jgi:DNA-binding CsgD family transcriptional regulator